MAIAGAPAGAGGPGPRVPSRRRAARIWRTASYAVVVRGREPESKAQFDSRSLGPGDYFTVNPLRPGAYGVSNMLTKGEARLVVAYPHVDRGRRETAAPASIRATQQGFSPESAQIQPMQGIVFHIEAPSRIRFRLLEPHERPPGKDTGKGRRAR